MPHLWQIQEKIYMTPGTCIGGRVYGIPLNDGAFHCFNVVGDCVFDLTSEQFGDTVLDYENSVEQAREAHFSREEKRLRYELLKKRFREA